MDPDSELITCRGKIDYGSRDEAQKQVRRFKKRYQLSGKRRPRPPTPYKCRHCGGWHIGRRRRV